MYVNPLNKCIEDERVQYIGYSYWEYVRHRHWLHFADDTALVTTYEEDNQTLLDVFTKWCRWAGFQVRVNKCSIHLESSTTGKILRNLSLISK
jgi:hypothetical protein